MGFSRQEYCRSLQNTYCAWLKPYNHRVTTAHSLLHQSLELPLFSLSPQVGPFYITHLSGTMQYSFFHGWPIAVGIISSKFIQVIAYDSVLLVYFLKAGYYSTVCVCVCVCVCACVCADILSICFFTDGHVGCFHVFAIVNNDAKNRGVWIPLVDNDFTSFR